MMETLTSLIPHGLPIVGGGFMGFVLGYISRKLIKIAIVGLGLIFGLLAFLEYKKWIAVDWAVVQNQTNHFFQRSSQQMIAVVNNTATELSKHNLNHLDVEYPFLGVAGFIPGFIFGLTRG
jgi:uncharacterized membrane protein (Fun14 family)